MENEGHTYLVSKKIQTLKVFVKARRNKVVEFSNDTIVFRLIIAVMCRVAGADLTEIFGVGFAEVR